VDSLGDWFGSNSINAFQMFGLHHLLFILIYLIGMGFLLIYSNTFKQNRKWFEMIRWGLFIILVSSELSYQSWGLTNGMWNASEYLPFQLCSIAGIVTMLALLTRNSKLIQIILFIGIVPSFLAVVTPELHHAYPHFRFWQFFIHHIALSWGSLFLVVTSSIQLTFKKTMETYIYLLLYAALTGFVVNPLFGGNFLFLARTPAASTPLDLLGNGFWYYVNLCLVGLAVFLAIYGTYKLINRNKQKNNLTSLKRN
jgi:hypothetical integral membrane protein (TIGR02206 family)